MRYNDKLYGEIVLPDYIGEIMETPLFQRLKDISQGVLPRSMVTWPLASRFEHSVGVCHLMNLALKENGLKSEEPLLLVSALLHDAGNPPFSHLSESFLKKINGRTGESFLENTIGRFANHQIFDSLGITQEEIVAVVTGNHKPLSDILHGSMDVDNLDNVGRYWFEWSGGEKLFDGEMIARSYLLRSASTSEEKEHWCLHGACQSEVERWQDARSAVYKKVYSEPDLNASQMIRRAVCLAERFGEIDEEFFYLSDTEAIEYLLSCNEWSAHLASRAKAHEWYKQVYNMETTEPPEGLVRCCKMGLFLDMVADYAREQLKIPPCMICAYAGRGRDARKVDLPFIFSDGVASGGKDLKTIYRYKVYLDPDYAHKAESAKFWADYMIS